MRTVEAVELQEQVVEVGEAAVEDERERHLREAGVAAAGVGVAALDEDVEAPELAPDVIELNSTFFWFDACAS